MRFLPVEKFFNPFTTSLIDSNCEALEIRLYSTFKVSKFLRLVSGPTPHSAGQAPHGNLADTVSRFHFNWGEFAIIILSIFSKRFVFSSCHSCSRFSNFVGQNSVVLIKYSSFFPLVSKCLSYFYRF